MQRTELLFLFLPKAGPDVTTLMAVMFQFFVVIASIATGNF